jgi:hypothetical protein
MQNAKCKMQNAKCKMQNDQLQAQPDAKDDLDAECRLAANVTTRTGAGCFILHFAFCILPLSRALDAGADRLLDLG